MYSSKSFLCFRGMGSPRVGISYNWELQAFLVGSLDAEFREPGI